ncbi:MAG: TIGR01906 family membrane protein [Anaerolineaceae bacterium]
MKVNINKVFAAIIALLIPFIILMGGVRLIMTPTFPALEYKRAGFPMDDYGFDPVDRTKWSAFAVNYLTNDEDINYLGDLQDTNGNKLFRAEELTHMEDVKRVVKGSLFIWYVACGILFGLTVWLLVQKAWREFRLGYRSGAWITLSLMAVMIAYLAINFNQLFDQFHRVFFTEGSWLFYPTDTLIRLFPMVFWRDAFLLVGGFTLLLAIVILFITKRKTRSKNSSAEKMNS